MPEVKKIKIFSHVLKREEKYKIASGDVYDSILSVSDSQDRELDRFTRVNVDATSRLGYPLEMSNGQYGGIVGLHRGKYPGIFIFDMQFFDKVQKWTDFKFNYMSIARKVPGIYTNPKHENKPVIWFVNIHKGGYDWDWSEGCITILTADYDRFIQLFMLNEKVLIDKLDSKEGL